MASPITGTSIIYPTVCSGVNKKKTSKLCATGLCEGDSPVNSPHKWPITRICFHLMTSSCNVKHNIRISSGLRKTLLLQSHLANLTNQKHQPTQNIHNNVPIFWQTLQRQCLDEMPRFSYPVLQFWWVPSNSPLSHEIQQTSPSRSKHHIGLKENCAFLLHWLTS